MKKAKILVVGSLNMDITATTNIFPNEGETVFGNCLTSAAGGKGLNQACQLGLLNADVKMLGAVGNDGNGQALLATLNKMGVDCQDIVIKNDVASGAAIILLEMDDEGNGANRIIVIPGANTAFNYHDIKVIEDIIKEYDMVVLQLEVAMEVNEKVAALARANGVKVMLNPAPYAPLSKELLANIDYLSPNEHELKAMTGVEVCDNGIFFEERLKTAYESLKGLGLKALLVTMGDVGSAFTDGEKIHYVPSIKTIAIDTTAAGDSFVSSFCLKIAEDESVLQAMEFATKVASYTVSHKGASSSLPKIEDIV